MSLIIKEILTKRDLKNFIRFSDRLYSGNKFYIPALHTKELGTLSVDKNPAFEFCKAKYWMVIKDGEIAGRIAGIINDKYNEKHHVKYVRFGWLDFVEDMEVLKLLFNALENWALNEKMEHIHGPLGFTSFDASGILIEGFDELPTSFAHYNFPYYPNLIEKLGYNKDVDWVEYNVKAPKSIPEKFTSGTELVKERYNLKSAKLKNKKDILDHADEIFRLINTEYKELYAFTELSNKQIELLKKQFISMLNPKYVSIILSETNEVVGFGITMPSLAKALQKAKGRLFPFAFIHIMFALNINNTIDSLLIAIKKEYQNRGVNALIFNDIMRTSIKEGITNLESNRELENNMGVNNLWNKFEYRQHKRTRCYIKKL